MRAAQGIELVKANSSMLDRMFAPWIFRSVSKYSNEQVEEYIWDLEEICKRRCDLYEPSLLAQEILRRTIGENLQMMGWQVKYERLYSDFDISHRFDIMARKRSKTIVVEIKPELTTKILNEILPYLSSVELKIKDTRVLLGTDILNLNLIRDDKSLLHILNDYSKKRRVGVFLADAKNAWLLPDEFIRILYETKEEAAAA